MKLVVSKRSKFAKNCGTFFVTVALSTTASAMQQGQEQGKVGQTVPWTETHRDSPVYNEDQHLFDSEYTHRSHIHTTYFTKTWTKKWQDQEIYSDSESWEEPAPAPTSTTVIKHKQPKVSQDKGKCATEVAVPQIPTKVVAVDTKSQDSSTPMPVQAADLVQGKQAQAPVCEDKVATKVVGQSQAQECSKELYVPNAACCDIPCETMVDEYVFRDSLQQRNIKWLNQERKSCRSKKQVMQARDFVISEKFGHKYSHDHHRAKDWKQSQFNNFAFENINGSSINAHQAKWHGFYLNGQLRDWNFQGASLERGWFNGRLKSLDFSGAHLKDMRFLGSTLGKSSVKGHGTSFERAILENVSFEGARFEDVNFYGAIFYSDSSFKNTSINFRTQFVGAKIRDCAGKDHEISWQQAQRLDNRYRTWNKQKPFTGAQMLEVMQGH